MFLTDGRGRTVSIGGRKIVLRHIPPRQMATAGRTSGTIIQALRWLGKKNIDKTTVLKIRRQLGPGDRKDLLRSTRYAPAWIAQILREIVQEEEA